VSASVVDLALTDKLEATRSLRPPPSQGAVTHPGAGMAGATRIDSKLTDVERT
jgi:hypothetical protein